MHKLFIFFIVVFLFAFSTISAFAHSGCCSPHEGVRADGCGCNDGTSLSSTCAPYYTCTVNTKNTNEINTNQIVPFTQQTIYPIPTNIPTDTPMPIPTDSPIPMSDPTQAPIAVADTNVSGNSGAGFVGFLAIVGICYFLLKKRKRKRAKIF